MNPFKWNWIWVAVGVCTSCTLTASRPVQEMSDCRAAIQAAKEVGADSVSPEFYRKATEAYFKAQEEYAFRNFYAARIFANKARKYAEQAEYDSVLNGQKRESLAPPEEQTKSEEPYKMAPPKQIPAYQLEQESKAGGSSGK